MEKLKNITVEVGEITNTQGNTVYHTIVKKNDSLESNESTYIPVVQHKTRGWLVVSDKEEAFKVRNGETNNFIGIPALESETGCFSGSILAKKVAERVYSDIYILNK